MPRVEGIEAEARTYPSACAPGVTPGCTRARRAPGLAHVARGVDQHLVDRLAGHAAGYGHFGQGLVHCRINFGLRSPGGLERYRAFMDEVSSLVVSHGGVFSGEHGDGQSKAMFMEKLYGPELVQAFREFKAIWDPDGLMNPRKLIEPYRIDENLKLGTSYNPPNPDVHFNYPEDGGSFAHAALRCVGAGKCRDVTEGTMCPS
jgi:FAD/FMN-containing dehydrogenase